MSNSTVVELQKSRQVFEDQLTLLLREGAQRMLATAVEAEIQAFLVSYAGERNPVGLQRLVRNGHLPEREIQTGIGPVKVRMPRVRDTGAGAVGRIRFTSKILPPYLRRTRSLEELIPWLYLKGISTGDFSEALAALLGPDAPSLSPSSISRLKEVWKDEFGAWQGRDLSRKRYVYFWADGVYFNVRLEEDKQCILVIIGADESGRKELVGLLDGYRESEQSWKELLLDLKRRGLEISPKLAVGDGALGFWKALPQVYSNVRRQRCWVHKTANMLNYLPKGVEERAKAHLQEIWMAKTRAEAEKAFDFFLDVYGAKYPKATGCLDKDRDDLLAFYDFPAEHWKHIRTSNPIESTFATVRQRTYKTKNCCSRQTILTMVFRLCLSAQKKWRRLDGSPRLAEVIEGIKFVDGIREERKAA
jgi:transposase-like protein